ncbi:MAG: hypothetical protein ACOX7F_03235 [Eubacteriales bacterium]
MDFLKKLDAHWQKKPAERPGRRGQKFEHVKTRVRAWGLCEYGGLQAVYRIPVELGGSTEEENILFLPGYAADQLIPLQEKLVQLHQMGELTGFSVEPEYREESLVPISVRVTAQGSKPFDQEVVVW